MIVFAKRQVHEWPNSDYLHAGAIGNQIVMARFHLCFIISLDLLEYYWLHEISAIPSHRPSRHHSRAANHSTAFRCRRSVFRHGG